MSAGASIVLVSNGPGELHTWVKPILAELRSRSPATRAVVSLIPCQFASGGESEAAREFDPDGVTTPGQYLRIAAGGKLPVDLAGDVQAVLSLGGNVGMAVKLSRRLSAPVFRYSFVPYWHPRLETLFVHDRRAYRKARLLGAPPSRLSIAGNLVADAVLASEPLKEPGTPHVLLLAGSRDGFAVHLIPFMIAVADQLSRRYPWARFVWPVSRLLSREAIEAGIAGAERETLGGVAGRTEAGSTEPGSTEPGRTDPGSSDPVRIVTPGGAYIEMVAEEEKYRQMAAADVAVTIPGTNTLELGIAGVPSVVLLPLNKPEIIPLEGPGHWLSLLPLVGTPLKRRAVKLFVEGLSYPVSLPNQLTGESLMIEMRGKIYPGEVAGRVESLLEDQVDLARRKARLLETMPKPGAAARILDRVMQPSGVHAT